MKTPSKFSFRGIRFRKITKEYLNSNISVYPSYITKKDEYRYWKIQHDIVIPRIHYLQGNSK